MTDIIRKLTSRKFWMAVAGIATGVAMTLGVDSTEITAVAGGIVAVISCVTFIITEGKIDAESVKKAVEGAQTAVGTIEGGAEQ